MNDKSRESALSQGQIDTYWRDGFVRVNGVFDDEDITRWREECDRLWRVLDETNPRVERRGHREKGDIADRIDPVMDVSPEFERVACDRRTMGVASAVLGAEVRILKAKLIMKRPGTMGYELHQDYPYWEFLGVPADHIAILLITMDVSDCESGAIEFFPRCHHERIAPPEHSPLDTDPSKVDLETGVILELEPRDVTVFHPLTPHRSAPNLSNHSRRALYYTFHRAEHGDLLTRYYANRPA